MPSFLLDGGFIILITTGSMMKVDRSVLGVAIQQVMERMQALPKVEFRAAVCACIDAKRVRRPRTVAEIRSVCGRLMRLVPGLAECPVQGICRADCAAWLQLIASPRQQHKLRVILHGIFEYCVRQEWCFCNPVAALPAPELVEQEISPLDWESLRRLLKVARRAEHRACMPPLGLMLWAGVRPAEVTRLQWSALDWDESVISLQPRHSKTGGKRHVQLHAVLKAWLREYGVQQGCICPPNWPRRWRRLRDAAGLHPWKQDVLRHTFASYHTKYFHDFARLQEDMGHGSLALLRTRYLSMQGLTAARAELFWKPGAL